MSKIYKNRFLIFLCVGMVVNFMGIVSCKNPVKPAKNLQNDSANKSDWPNWRGPSWTGISTEQGWDPARLKTENVLWENNLGRSYSSPVIAGGRVYVQGRAKKNEVLYCLDSLNGSIIWQTEFPEDIGGSTLPQSTPTIDDGLVYFLSPHGTVHCLEALTGNVVWEKRLMWDFDVEVPLWNFSGSVRIEGRLAIINAGFGFALDKKTGEVIWANEKGKCGYSTPVIYWDGDSQRIAMGALNDMNILDFETGRVLYTFPWKHISQQDTPADPLVTADGVLISSVMQRGAVYVKMDSTGNKILWNKREISNISSFVYIDGFLYGNSNPNYGDSAGFDSEFFCMELATGNKKWSKDSGLGTVIAVGDYLIRQGQNGVLEIGLIDKKDFIPLAELKVFKAPAYAHPAFAQGLLVTKNEAGHIVCFDMKKR